MVFRVVNESPFPFTFQTDLPVESRNVHPSGVLHAYRCDTTNGVLQSRRGDTFAWVANSVHIEEAIEHLEKNGGFDRNLGIVFIPYSTKKNWLARYPNTSISIECTGIGKVVVDSIDSLGPLGSTNANDDNGDSDKTSSALCEAEREELHIQIYNYFSWLHEQILDSEKNATPDVESDDVKMGESDDVKMVSLDDNEKGTEANNNATGSVDGNVKDATGSVGENKKESKRETESTNTSTGGVNYDEKESEAKNSTNEIDLGKGVDALELQVVLDKLQSAFAILPKIKEAEEKESAAAESPPKEKRPPILEKVLGQALALLVVGREKEKKLAAEAEKEKRRRRRNRIKAGEAVAYNQRYPEFDDIFEKLVKYKEEHGHCEIPTRYVSPEEDRKLGNFVDAMRRKHAGLKKQGLEFEVVPQTKRIYSRTLTEERRERLNSIGFVWSVAAPKIEWEDRFKQLVKYHEVSKSWPPTKETSLGMWVTRQRKMYQTKNKSFMEHRAPKLDEIGFDWSPAVTRKLKAVAAIRKSKEASSSQKEQQSGEGLNDMVGARESPVKPKRFLTSFGKMFPKLVEYKEEHGHCDVPLNYLENPELACFVEHVRSRKFTLNKQGKDFEDVPPGKATCGKALTAERVKLLNSLGFVWTVLTPKVTWEERFREMLEYYRANRTWPSTNLGTFGRWVEQQRRSYVKKDEKYMKDKASKLDKVGFDWEPLVTKRDDNKAEQLRRKAEVAVEEELSKPPPPKKETLDTPDLVLSEGGTGNEFVGVKTLVEKPIPKPIYKPTPKPIIPLEFEEAFQKLVEFKKKHGHCWVPNSGKENPQLSIFVFLIRRRKLSLLKRGMGHEDVPQGDPIWASTLTSERVERLNSIGFVWSTARPQRIEKPTYKPIYKPIIPLEFEEAFQKLVEYKEKHGHCWVPTSGKENPQLSNFAFLIRSRKSSLLKRGMEYEDVPQGDRIWTSTLTSERVERLNSIGFVWSITGPLPTWEDRFKEMMECYKSTGNWPDQSKGPLYKWVCRQRGLYAKKDETFMKEKAPKLDGIGFLWAIPRKKRDTPKKDEKATTRVWV